LTVRFRDVSGGGHGNFDGENATFAKNAANGWEWYGVTIAAWKPLNVAATGTTLWAICLPQPP
jgi:hypothetical protein